MKYFASLVLLCAAFILSSRYGTVMSLPGAAMDLGAEEDRDVIIRHEFERLRNPLTNSIPEDIHQGEAAFVSTLPVHSESVFAKSGTAEESLHLENDWVNHSIEQTGGRTRAIAIDVDNENVLLAGSVGGGVWRSTNAGTTWSKTTANNNTHCVSSLVQDSRPGKHKVWYHGTGEMLGGSGGQPLYFWDIGSGIFKSFDGGQTWSVLPSTEAKKVPGPTSPFHFVYRVAIDPARQDSDIVYAACNGCIMRSNDGGASWNYAIGYKTNQSTGVWTDVIVTPKGVVYASVTGSSSSSAGIWRSKDGLVWTNISSSSAIGTLNGRTCLAYAPSNPNVVWISTYQTSSYQYSILWKYTYLSGDGKGSGCILESRSSYMNTLGSGFTQSGYSMFIAVFPQSDDHVLLGGKNLFVSTDGFTSASNISHVGGYSKEYFQSNQFDIIRPETYHFPNNHPDMHAGVFIPSNPQAAIVCTDGGVFATTNIFDLESSNVQWRNLNTNYNVAQFYGVAIDPFGYKDGIVLGGAQDNGTSIGKRDGRPMQWILSADGMIGDVARNHASVYPAYQYGGLYRVLLNATMDTVVEYGSVRPNYTQSAFYFTAPLCLDPVYDSVLYMLSNDRLYRNYNITAAPLTNTTQNNAVGWRYTTLSGFGMSQYNLPGSRVLTAFGVSTFPAHRVYLGSSGGSMFFIEDASQTSPTVTQLATGNMPSAAFVNCIKVDPVDANEVFVVFSNYAVRSVFRTTDAGDSWESISGNLEEHPDGSGYGPSCKWIEVLHYKNQVLYLLGTSSGVLTTTKLDGDNTVWTREAAIPAVNVDMIRARSTDGFVAIATHGLGIYSTYAVTGPLSEVKSDQNTFNVRCAPNPAHNHAELHYVLPTATDLEITLYGADGRKLRQLSRGYMTEGTHSLPLDLRDLQPAQYFIRVSSSNRAAQMIKLTHY